MKDKEYEKHKKRMREYYQTGNGKIRYKARKEAVNWLIKKHKKEFDKLFKQYLEVNNEHRE